MTGSRSLLVTVALSATLAAPFAAGTAEAKGGAAAVTKSGTCAGGATYTLKAKHDDGLIEVEWQVDSNHNGQKWSVRLRDNGYLFLSGARTTQAPSGSFTVRHNVNNRAGGDVIRARSTRGDNVCTASLTV